MELRQYGDVLIRRWPIWVGVTVVAFIGRIILFRRGVLYGALCVARDVLYVVPDAAPFLMFEPQLPMLWWLLTPLRARRRRPIP